MYNHIRFQFGELILFQARCVSQILFVCLRYLLRYRYPVIEKNLRQALPGKSDTEIREVINHYYRHISDLCVEPLLFYTAPAFLRERLTIFDEVGILDRLYNGRKNVVLLASHYGNWEYLVNLPSRTQYKVSTGYSPASNSTINRFLLKVRSRFGVNLIPKHLFYRRSIHLLNRQDEPNMVVVIADQRPGPDSRKHHLPFLGIKTDVQVGAERMAMHTNAAVVLVESVKVARFQYRYRFHLLNDNPQEEPTSPAITARYFQSLENAIRVAPVYWLWSHDRWKKANAAS